MFQANATLAMLPAFKFMLPRSLTAVMLSGLALFSGGLGKAQVLSLQTPSGVLAPSTVVSVDVVLTSNGGVAPAALQWTLLFPVTDMQLLQVTNGAASIAAGKILSCSPGYGATTCVLTGSDAATIGDGAIASVSFLTNATFGGFSSVALPAPVAASATGDPIVMGGIGSAVGSGAILGFPGCTYSLNANGQIVPADGATVTISIATAPGCSWQIQNAASWITASSATSGTGSADVTLMVSPDSTAARSATILAGGLAFSIIQSAMDGSFVDTSLSTGGIPHIAAGGPWKTTIALLNTGTAPATSIVDVFDNSGSPVAFPWNFPQTATSATSATIVQNLPAGATFLMETLDTPSLVEGWAQLHTTGSVQGFAIFQNTVTHQEAVVPVESRPTGLHILAFDNTGGVTTGLAISNSMQASIDVPVRFRDLAGGLIGSSSVHLSPLGHTSFMLPLQFPVTASRSGTIEFVPAAGTQIGVVGLRANGAALTTLPILTEYPKDGTGSAPHVVSGPDWTTTLTLVDIQNATATATTQWFDEGGAPMTLSMLNVKSGATTNVSATSDAALSGSSIVYSTPSVKPASQSVGSTQITAPGMNGFAIFRFAPTGQEAAVPMEIRNASSYALLFDNSNGFATGMAVANLSGQPADIPVTITDDTGAVLGNEVIHLAANGHTSFMTAAVYVYMDNKRGSVEFGTPAGGRISVIGLRGTSYGTLTTLPVFAKGTLFSVSVPAVASTSTAVSSGGTGGGTSGGSTGGTTGGSGEGSGGGTTGPGPSDGVR